MSESERTQSNHNFPLIGDQFPEMEVQTTEGTLKLPSHFSNQWFVLFSHPADFTPVCTTEFVGFAKRYDQFQDLDTALIGLSIDQIFSHIKWVEWIEDNLDVDIPFPVIADDRGRVASSLGMVHPNKGTNTVRAVFVVDDNSLIRTILYYPQELGRNMDEIVRVVRALKTGEANEGAMPANWPNNELIEDEVIVSPPKDRKSVEQRTSDYTCYDWWFCHKQAK